MRSRGNAVAATGAEPQSRHSCFKEAGQSWALAEASWVIIGKLAAVEDDDSNRNRWFHSPAVAGLIIAAAAAGSATTVKSEGGCARLSNGVNRVSE